MELQWPDPNAGIRGQTKEVMMAWLGRAEDDANPQGPMCVVRNRVNDPNIREFYAGILDKTTGIFHWAYADPWLCVMDKKWAFSFEDAQDPADIALRKELLSYAPECKQAANYIQKYSLGWQIMYDDPDVYPDVTGGAVMYCEEHLYIKNPPSWKFEFPVQTCKIGTQLYFKKAA